MLSFFLLKSIAKLWGIVKGWQIPKIADISATHIVFCPFKAQMGTLVT